MAEEISQPVMPSGSDLSALDGRDIGTAIRSGPHPRSILIKNGTILTLNPAFEIIEPGYLLTEEDRIRHLGTMNGCPPDGSAEAVLDAGNCLIMPGLVNTHTHAAMSILRGLADDLPLQQWLEEYIFPIEARYVNPGFVYLGTLLAGLEMIRSGTTCFCDGYFFENEASRAVADLGLRATLGQGVVDFPTPDVPDPASNVDHARKFLEGFPDHPRITPSLFCHSGYTCAPDTIRRIRDLCRHHGVPFQIHLAETEAEVAEIRKRHGRTPAGHAEAVGVLNGGIIAAHCVWLTPEDVDILARNRVGVAHCPESNLKLASGIAPIPTFLNRGIPVGLGSDGCASNNNLDLFGEMDTAAKIQKGIGRDPTILDARTVVTLATRGGAEVLGLADRIGSLEPGKQADLIFLDWNQPHLTPTYSYYSHLVYAATGADVVTMIVAGRLVMHQRRILTVDEPEILREARALGARIRSGREGGPEQT